MTATLHSEGDHHTLRFERVFRHPVADVWSAITDPALMAAWFPVRVEYPELATGAEMTFTFEGEDEPPTHGTIEALEEPNVFAFTWDGDLVRFELEDGNPQSDDATNPKCQLVLSASFDDRTWAVRNAAGWHMCLDLLKAALLDEQPKSPVGKRQSQLLKQYETLFSGA